MEMSKAEIIREYRTAKNPRKQIHILAELNAVKTSDIVDILEAAGELSPRSAGQYKRHLPSETNETTEQVQKDAEREPFAETPAAKAPKILIEIAQQFLAAMEKNYREALLVIEEYESVRNWLKGGAADE